MRPSARLAAATGLLTVGLLMGAVPVAAADPSVYQVKNIRPGAANSSPRELAAAGDTLYFSANDGTSGRELWRSDASAIGTRRVKNIRPGSASSNPTHLTPMGGLVFFVANDGTTGRELWRTDGTATGTRRVKDIRVGAKGSKPQQLTAVGSTLFFTANDGSRGRELWKSDGTAAGTVIVRNINVASRWSSDVGSFYADHPGELTAFGGRLFFSPLRVLVGQYEGHEFGELWVSDGTRGGTKPFLGWDGLEGLDNILWPDELTKVGTRLFFRAAEDELWQSDGTETGTRSLGRVSPYELTNVGGALFFRGNEWSFPGGDQTSVNEGLWKSNGTTSGTKLVKAFPPDEPWCCQTGETITDLTNVAGTLFFTHRNEDLWMSSGSTAGTVRVLDVPSGATTTELTAVGPPFPGRLYFTVDGMLHQRTPSGTFASYPGLSNATNLTRVGALLYLSATDGTRGQELWVVVEGD